MEKHQPVIIYLAIFLLASLVLKMTGLINVSSIELLAYMLIIFGISYVFLSFGNNRKGILFTATIIFLMGVSVYLFNNFEFFDPTRLIYPSLVFMMGIGFLMIYIDGGLGLGYLIVSLGLIIFGMVLTFIRGDFSGSSFFHSLISVAGKYWIIIIISILIFLLIIFQEKRRR